MRDDLLDAQAAVDWSIAQFDSLKRRLISWREEPPYSFREEPHPEIGKKRIHLANTIQPSPIINAEVGAIINSLRSSLDVLVNTLAKRAGHTDPKDTHFPICRSKDDFFIGKHAGRKAIKRLSKADQALIENLEPWDGGNNPSLVALHNLDITRKHRRLIEITPVPGTIMIPTDSVKAGLRFNSMWDGFKDDAIVAWTGIGTDHSQIQIAFDITLNEAGSVAGKSIVTALNDFACLANSIIKLFDV